MPNLYAQLLPDSGAEQFVELLSRPGLRIERIVSAGQASPPGFWYDQAQAEWVLLLLGEASLAFEDEPAPRQLRPGDYVDIAPHRRHRVESTAAPTVWLAVHYDCKESSRRPAGAVATTDSSPMGTTENALPGLAVGHARDQPIASSSTSNTNVAFGGITPPAPRAP